MVISPRVIATGRAVRNDLVQALVGLVSASRVMTLRSQWVVEVIRLILIPARLETAKILFDSDGEHVTG